MITLTLRNTTASPIELTVLGFIVPALGEIQIAKQNYSLLGNENATIEWLPYVLSRDIVVYDGDYELPTKVAIGLLHQNPLVIQDYYTLVDEDGILTGNNQTLHLHEEDWEYEDEEFSEG
jgi:hypothetical protein